MITFDNFDYNSEPVGGIGINVLFSPVYPIENSTEHEFAELCDYRNNDVKEISKNSR